MLQEADLIRDMSYEAMPVAQLQQEHQRRYGGQGDTRGPMSVLPEQGRHSSPGVAEDDHDEARRLEPPTMKEKRSGRLQKLMGRHGWWSSRKKS